MTGEPSFLREASLEVQEAFLWYEEQRPGLGLEFLLALDALLEQVRRNPQASAPLRSRTRKAVMRRFPYVVLYAVEEDGSLLVTSVYHGHRHPRAWSDRVREARPAQPRSERRLPQSH